MTIKESSSLLIWCGALNDIAEKCNKYNAITAKQIKDVQDRIEELVILSIFNQYSNFNLIK